MSIPTVLIGLLPTYSQAGSLATLSLIVLRLIQGLAAGGERPILGCYIFENAPVKHKEILCSSIVASGALGVFFRLFDCCGTNVTCPANGYDDMGLAYSFFVRNTHELLYILYSKVDSRASQLSTKQITNPFTEYIPGR
jgi:hypothetical protein